MSTDVAYIGFNFPGHIFRLLPSPVVKSYQIKTDTDCPGICSQKTWGHRNVHPSAQVLVEKVQGSNPGQNKVLQGMKSHLIISTQQLSEDVRVDSPSEYSYQRWFFPDALPASSKVYSAALCLPHFMARSCSSPPFPLDSSWSSWSPR